MKVDADFVYFENVGGAVNLPCIGVDISPIDGDLGPRAVVVRVADGPDLFLESGKAHIRKDGVDLMTVDLDANAILAVQHADD